jgi:hypothetical protein
MCVLCVLCVCLCLCVCECECVCVLCVLCVCVRVCVCGNTKGAVGQPAAHSEDQLAIAHKRTDMTTI